MTTKQTQKFDAHTADAKIGLRIKKARLLMTNSSGAPMTQTELGEAVGVSFQQIQKYENGTNRIMGSRLWAIAAALGQDISYFFQDLGKTADERSPVADGALVTARMFHELPDGEMKRHVYSLIKSFHSTSVGTKATG